MITFAAGVIVGSIGTWCFVGFMIIIAVGGGDYGKTD